MDSISTGSQYRQYLGGNRFSNTIEAQWRTIACEGAYTGPHVDGGGLATWERICKGTKLWCFHFRDNFTEDVPSICPNEEDPLRWTLLILQEGDMLFVSSCSIRLSPNITLNYSCMSPGAIHMVAGPMDCVIDGGHFSTRSTSVHSLYELLEVEKYHYDNSNGEYYLTSVGYRIELLHALMSEVTSDPQLVRKPG